MLKLLPSAVQPRPSALNLIARNYFVQDLLRLLLKRILWVQCLHRIEISLLTWQGGPMASFRGAPKFNRSESPAQSSLVRTYEVVSTASVDDLWKTITNLTDVSWHPILSSTNVPNGLVVKPGLIYQAFTRMIPIPVQIFVERVRPKELLSVRILVMPGLEEQVTYQVQSTLCGACVSYSVTLRGWLSPLFWSLMRPCAARVASQLVQCAEQAACQAVAGSPMKPVKRSCLDF